MSEDPIEELFRQKSEESVGEKPRDLVWKRIETSLQNKEKKKKPLREFISSVWSSAAVFALIAVPYFILFIMNINADNESKLDIVKIDKIVIEETKKINDKVEVLDIKEIDLQPSASIVKNDEVQKASQKPMNTEPELENLGTFNELNNNDVLASDIAIMRTKTLDSIESNDQLALSSKLKKFSSNDSITSKPNNVIRGFNRLRAENAVAESTVFKEQNKSAPIANQQPSLNHTELVPGLSVSNTDKKMVNNADNIIYKPLKFVAKTDIVRTSFRLEKKSNNKITFVNKNVRVSFEKTADKIIIRTNEPKMNPNLVNLLETNKKEIFSYYQ